MDASQERGFGFSCTQLEYTGLGCTITRDESIKRCNHEWLSYSSNANLAVRLSILKNSPNSEIWSASRCFMLPED
jgi:hypothetical protein